MSKGGRAGSKGVGGVPLAWVEGVRHTNRMSTVRHMHVGYFMSFVLAATNPSVRFLLYWFNIITNAFSFNSEKGMIVN